MHYTLGLSCKSSFPLNRLWTAFMFSSSAINIHPRAGPFVISAGAILGICAGLLWTAQGSLMLAYPTEDQKGRFIGIFWGIFNIHSTVRMQFFGNRLPSLTMNCCTSG
jgi:hypothetical protein